MKKALILSSLVVTLAMPAFAADEALLKASASRSFKAWDTDHDGKVSKEEFLIGKKKQMDFDANHDGKLSLQELIALKNNDVKNKDLLDFDADQIQKMSEKQLKSHDTDKDGMLSESELLAGQEESFANMDMDHDGSLSEAELVASKIKYGH